MHELSYRSASECLALLRSGEVCSLELVDSCIARIEALNADVNAVVAKDYERARESARAADAARSKGEDLGALHGLPMTIKDSLETAGLVTTSGAPALRHHVPAKDAVAVQRALDAGFTTKFSAEFEFWIFQETPHSLHEKGFRGLDPLSPGMFGYSWLREGQYQVLVDDILDTCAAYDIEIEGIHTETGPGVWEAAIRYDEVLAAADKAALFKTTIKQICARHDLSATFMAKWNADLPGSSGHLHQSLWDAGGQINLFAAAGSDSLSETGLHYLGGLVSLAPELTALYSPFINSYKRYVPGVWAPLNASWGLENRTCGSRVILGPTDSAARIEFRQTAADINPYVAMSACLGSGLYGIDKKIEPPAETSGDATEASDPLLALPLTLEAALQQLSESDAAREVLGEAFVDHYTRTRDWECRQYNRAVSEWELQRYFEAV